MPFKKKCLTQNVSYHGLISNFLFKCSFWKNLNLCTRISFSNSYFFSETSILLILVEKNCNSIDLKLGFFFWRRCELSKRKIDVVACVKIAIKKKITQNTHDSLFLVFLTLFFYSFQKVLFTKYTDTRYFLQWKKKLLTSITALHLILLLHYFFHLIFFFYINFF